MRFPGSRRALAGLAVGALIGAGLATVTPAGAVVKEAAAAINWKVIWQTEIKPRADKRYFTKKKANARFYTKLQANGLFETKAAHDASLANYYTKAQSDANYYTKAQSDANYYTKAQSDAKYAPYPTLIRGTVMLTATAAAANGAAGESISYGVTLTAAPTVHYIPVGGVPPAECSGNAQAPNALAGHLCVFGGAEINAVPGAIGIFNITGGGGSNTMGAVMVARSTGAGEMIVAGSWALRPAAIAPPALQGAAGNTTKGTFGG
jgi:hypothetical protein